MHIYLPCDIFFFKISTFKLPKGDFILEIQRKKNLTEFFKISQEIRTRLTDWEYELMACMNQMKSVLVVKSATYTHSMEVKTLDFVV